MTETSGIPKRWRRVFAGEASDPEPGTRNRGWELGTEIRSPLSGDFASIREEEGRLVVLCGSDDPFCAGAADLLDIIAWVKENAPGLLK